MMVWFETLLFSFGLLAPDIFIKLIDPAESPQSDPETAPSLMPAPR